MSELLPVQQRVLEWILERSGQRAFSARAPVFPRVRFIPVGLDAATTTSAGSDGGSRVETDATALGADVVVVAPSDEED